MAGGKKNRLNIYLIHIPQKKILKKKKIGKTVGILLNNHLIKK